MSMNIPANTAINPDMNLGSLLQMLKTAGSDQAFGAGQNDGMSEDSTKSGNLFSQILNQQFALLLQSGDSESIEAQGALSNTLEKLLSENPNATSELIAQIEMLLMSGQIVPIVQDDEGILPSVGIGEQNPSSSKTESNFTDSKKQIIDQVIHNLMPQKSVAATFLPGFQKDDLNAFNAVASRITPEGLQDIAAFSKTDVLLQQDQIVGKPVLTEVPLKATADPDIKVKMVSSDAPIPWMAGTETQNKTSAHTKADGLLAQDTVVGKPVLTEVPLKATADPDIKVKMVSSDAPIPWMAGTETQNKTSAHTKADGLPAQDQVVGKPVLMEGQPKATTDPDAKVSLSSGYTDAELNVSVKGRDEIPAEKNIQHLLKDGQVKEPVFSGDQVKKADVSESREKGTAYENRDRAFQATIAQDKPFTDQGAVESHLNKTGAPFKNVVLDKDNRQNISSAVQADDHLSGSDEKKEMPLIPKQNVSGAQPSFNGYNPDSNTAGKAFALQIDSAEANEKIRTAYKIPAMPVGKNAESNPFNPTALSGVLPIKTESGDVTPSSIINRVAAEFRENLMNEGGRVRITLTPPSLGTLEMDISVQNSKVRVMLIAENKDVQRMLSGSLDALKGSLQTQGLTIERCDVMMQDRREEYSQGFNGQQAFHHDQEARERNFRREALDNQPLAVGVAPNVQKPVGRSILTGSESISLFV